MPSASTSPPVFLLADSAPLFVSREVPDALRSARGPGRGEVLRAAYVGASNGDAPEHFDVFLSAMQRAGADRAEQVSATFGAEDRRRIERADWIVLAGGDVERGWRALACSGMAAAIRRRRREGAVVIGISAGAVQLGLGTAVAGGGWLATFGLVPRVIDVHDEAGGWRRLDRAARRAEKSGIGIPSGGAARWPSGADPSRLEPLAGTVLHRTAVPTAPNDHADNGC